MLNSRVVWVTLAGCLTQSFLTGHSKGHPILSLLDKTRYILSFSSIDVQMRDALVLTSYSPECSWQLSRRKVWEPQNQFWTFWPKTHSTANPQRSSLWHPILLEEETGSNHNESIKSGWLTRLQSQHWCEPATQSVSVRLFSTFVVFILQTEKEMLQMKNIIFLTSVPRDLFCLCWEVRQHIPLKRGCGALGIEAEQVPESSQRCSLLRKPLLLCTSAQEDLERLTSDQEVRVCREQRVQGWLELGMERALIMVRAPRWLSQAAQLRSSFQNG